MLYTQDEYLRAVDLHAAEVLRRVRQEGQKLDEAIWEEAKFSKWAIYAPRVLCVLTWTKNENAVFDAGGGDEFATATCMADVYRTAAFWALRDDIFKAVAVRRGEDEGGEE